MKRLNPRQKSLPKPISTAKSAISDRSKNLNILNDLIKDLETEKLSTF